jgi:hypothetical protein
LLFFYWPESIHVTFHFLTYWLAKSNFGAIYNHIALLCKINEWNYVTLNTGIFLNHMKFLKVLKCYENLEFKKKIEILRNLWNFEEKNWTLNYYFFFLLDQYEVLWSRVQLYCMRRSRVQYCCTLLHKTSYWSRSSAVIVYWNEPARFCYRLYLTIIFKLHENFIILNFFEILWNFWKFWNFMKI